jgi:hypothetical protein
MDILVCAMPSYLWCPSHGYHVELVFRNCPLQFLEFYECMKLSLSSGVVWEKDIHKSVLCCGHIFLGWESSLKFYNGIYWEIGISSVNTQMDI